MKRFVDESAPRGDVEQQGASWVLLSTIVASGMAFIDATGLSVAMPVLQREMSATGADLLWINNAYSLPLASLLLLGGGLGDRYGRKRLFALGIALFAAASLACGLALQIPALIAARVCQGAGAALMIPGSLAILATFFHESKRGKAMGKWSAGTVVASAIGPVLGGLLAGMGHWRWIFFLNLPLAAFSLILLRFKVPPLREATARQPLDYQGACWGTIGLVALNHGLIRWPEAGFRSLVVLVSLAAGVTAFCLFVRVERRGRNPLLPLGLFKSRELTAASVLTVLFYTALNGMLFFLPLTLIGVQGYDPLRAGLAQLPIMAMLIAFSPWAGAMLDRHGPRLPLMVGSSTAGAGFLLLACPGVGRGPAEFWVSYFPGLMLLGAGLGLTAAPLSATVIGAVPPERFGAASGLNSTLARLSATLAMATLGPIFLAVFAWSLDDKIPSLNLPPTIITQIKTDVPRLIDAPPPADLPPESASQLESAKRLAFVDAFRGIALLAGALTWLGSAVLAGMIRPRSPGDRQ